MNEKSTWQTIIEDEIAQAVGMEKILAGAGLDETTQIIIRERTLLRLQQEMLNNY